MTLLLAALLAVQAPATKDDVIRLTREGVREEALLAYVSPVKFKLSVDDIVQLKTAGVSEKVIARMIEGPREAKVVNLAHKAVSIQLIGSEIHLNSEGTSVAPGATVALPASGELSIWVGGRETSCRVKTPATLTFRGSVHADFEVVTLYIDDARGSDTCRVEMRVNN